MQPLYRIALMAVVVTLCACTSARTIESSADELQRQISAHELIHPGDRVKIATLGGELYKIEVAEINSGLIVAEDGTEIPIVDVGALATREFSIGKTALLGSGILVAAMAYAAATLTIGLAL